MTECLTWSMIMDAVATGFLIFAVAALLFGAGYVVGIYKEKGNE